MKRTAPLSLGVLALAAALVALWSDDGPDRRADRAREPAAVATDRARDAVPPSRSSPEVDTSRVLTVRLVDRADQPEAARVCVAAAGAVEVVERLARGASVDVPVAGTVNVVAFADGAFAAAEYRDVVAPVLEIAFTPGVEIPGRFVDDRGDPVTGRQIKVVAEPLDPPWWIRKRESGWGEYEDIGGRRASFAAESDERGLFRLTGLRPGRYQVRAGTLIWGLLSPQPVEVVAGEEAVLVCPRTVRLQVLFVDARTREPITSTVRWSGSVRGRDHSSYSGSGRFGPDGTTIELEPGVQFEFHAQAEGCFAREGISIAVQREPGVQAVTFELEPDAGDVAIVTLIVRDDAGNPVGPLMVGRSMAANRRHPPGGEYVLKLPAGLHAITLRPPTDQVLLYRREFFTEHQGPDRPEVERVWLPVTVAIEVERGARVRREVTMQRAGLIWIRTKPGMSVTNVVVSRPWPGRRMWKLYDNKGQVALAEPGECEVRARHGDHTFSVKVSVKADEVATVWFPPPDGGR